MKKFLALLLAAITVVSCAACGGTVETSSDTEIDGGDMTEISDTDAPVTDAPVTEAPVTEAPESDSEFEVPLDPTFDPDEEEKGADMIFEFNFDGSGNYGNEDFSVGADGWSANADNSAVVNGAPNKQLTVSDKKLALSNKSFISEMDVMFSELPHKADGVTNFPLSIISWIRQTSSQTYYDWVFKLDDEGYIYIKDTSTRTDCKIEAGKKYTLGVYFDDINGSVRVYVDGQMVGTRGINHRDAVSSTIRFFDSGNEKAHFNAEVSAVRCYSASDESLLGDATMSIYDAVAENGNVSLCFSGYTDKDALSYAVGEEISIEIYLLADGKVVSAPYFYYTVEGEDGQKKSEGYADGSKGHFTVKGKLTKPGALRVEAYICDANKVKQTKNNSLFYVELDTSTPQKADLRFRGGAIAGFEQIVAGGKIPTDLGAYWDGVVSDCYKGDIKLLRFEELDPSAYGGLASKHSLYLFEIECAGGFSTGYLTVPKSGSSLKLNVSFVSYGNKKKPTPKFYDGTAAMAICAHSYHLDDPNAAAPDSYGFNNTENQNRDTVYFKNMLIRNIVATRFLKAYVGDGSYGRIVYGGQTVTPLGKWRVGDEYAVSGGSQASFQSVAITAMDNDVTSASFGVPWFCDIGGDLVGRFDGWNPDYTDALMYYDSCALATLIESDVKVTITAGLGDTTSEPSGVVALYNALDCPKTMTMYQNREHTYDPPVRAAYKIKEG